MATSCADIPSAWAQIIGCRAPEVWDDTAEEDLPIPHDFVAVRAYYSYVSRGRTDGFDLDDWLEANRALRHVFREHVDSLRVSKWSNAADATGEDRVDREAKPIEPVDQDSETAGISVREQWTSRTGLGSMGIMVKKRSLRQISPDDPRVHSIAEALSKRKAAQVSEGDRDRYHGKVLAVLTDTGEVIACAATAEELQALVRQSEYCGRAWRLVDGPTGATPMTVEELKSMP